MPHKPGHSIFLTWFSNHGDFTTSEKRSIFQTTKSLVAFELMIAGKCDHAPSVFKSIFLNPLITACSL